MPQLTLIEGGIFSKKDLVIPENWKMRGDEIAEELREAAAKPASEKEDKVLWRLGDWLIQGEDYLKGRGYSLKYAGEVFGLSNGRLKNIKTVCRGFPEGRRRRGISFSIHEALKTLSEERQEELLDWAEAEPKQHYANCKKGVPRPVSVRELDKHIKQSAGKKKERTYEAVKILLSEQNFDILTNIAGIFDIAESQRQPRTGSLLFGMALIYFREHRDEITARMNAYKADPHAPKPRLPSSELLESPKPMETDEEKRVREVDAQAEAERNRKLEEEAPEREKARLEQIKNPAPLSQHWHLKRRQARFLREELTKPEGKRHEQFERLLTFWEKRHGKLEEYDVSWSLQDIAG